MPLFRSEPPRSRPIAIGRPWPPAPVRQLPYGAAPAVAGLLLALVQGGAISSPTVPRAPASSLAAPEAGQTEQPAGTATMGRAGDGTESAAQERVATEAGSNPGAAPVTHPEALSSAPLPSWPLLAELLQLPPWLNLTLTINAAPIANPLGGLSAAANWMQQNELTVTAGSGLGLEPSRWRGELDHWQARLRLDVTNGQPTFGSTIGSLFAPQTMAYAPGLYLSGLSVMRSSRDQSLQISAGYQSLDQDFLVAPAFTAYLYSGFNDTLNLTLPGLPITPFAAPSLVLQWRRPGIGRWSLGSYWLDQETELAGLFGAPPALSQDLRGNLQVLQWDLPLWSGDSTLKRPITLSDGETVKRQLPAPLLQLGAFRNHSRFFAPADSPTGRSTLLNHVAYGSVTLPARLPLGLDNRVWGTVQWGLNPSQNITPLFLAGGWQCQGLFPGRPLDVLSLGVGRTAFSPVLLPQLNWSGAVELNYTVQISNRLSLQPVIQWILRPSGDGSVPAIVTTALQLNLMF